MPITSIRVLTLIESSQAVGPARSLIEIAKAGAMTEPPLPHLELVIGTYFRGEGNSPMAQAALDAGVRAYTIRERGRGDVQAMQGLQRLIDEVRPDILESQNIKSHLFIRLLRAYKKYPWVIWNHGYTATSRRDRLYGQLDRWSLRKAFRAVTVCNAFADRMSRRGLPRERILVKHSFVRPFQRSPEEEIDRLKRKLGLRDEKIILAVGRLSQEKGHADLLRAIALLDTELPPFRVLIVGDGPERQSLVELADSLGISSKIAMLGQQGEVRPFYSMADLMALPSHSEGSPYVVLEALAAGVPIAATRVGGVPEILTHAETGLLVPSKNPQAMADALRCLLTDEQLGRRLADAGEAHAKAHFDFRNYMESLIQFYEQTLIDWKAHHG